MVGGGVEEVVAERDQQHIQFKQFWEEFFPVVQEPSQTANLRQSAFQFEALQDV